MTPRRRFTGRLLTGVCAVSLTSLTVLTVLTACATDGDGHSGTSGTDAADTITFDYAGRQVEIPADPQRVVCIETRLCPEFAEITGLNLVATPEITAESAEDNVVNDDLPDSVTRYPFDTTAPDAEVVADMEPDLIITTAAWFDTYDSEQQERLEGIAPVLGLDGDLTSESEAEGAENSDAWLQPLLDQAEQMGRRDDAEQSIADYHHVIDEGRSTLSAYEGKTVAVVALQDDQFVLEDENLAPEVLTDLGLSLLTDSGSREPDGSLRLYSKENLNILTEADVILVQNPDSPVADDALWKRLPAVMDGKTPQLLYNHRAGYSKVGADFAEYVVEQLSA
ncbi:MAG: ABC transporter substrate-binding protein [Corynebacterium sp.]|uniref:ABC transporter substrate-binding protein n=1 Tax=Corynebacterium sp. TaxID=1720 RepID=UPI003F0AFF6D